MIRTSGLARVLICLTVIGALAAAALSTDRSKVPASAASLDTGKTGSYANVARTLAKGVYAAPSATARRKALLATVKALHIGVYAGNARRVARGSERGPKDLYLYNAEITALADAIGRHTVISLAAMAQAAGALGFTSAGKASDPALYGQALMGGVKDSMSHPTRFNSLVLLLVRELGMRHNPPYDLAQTIPADTLQLDPLQRFLLTASLIMPAIRQDEKSHGYSLPVKVAGAFRPASRVQEACDPGPLLSTIKGALPPLDWLAFVKAFSDASGTPINQVIDKSVAIAKATSAVLWAKLILSILHTNVLSNIVDRQMVTPNDQIAHYGPAGHPAVLGVPGQPIRFTVEVSMPVSIPDSVIECGAAIGIKLPKKGPIKGVSVLWEPKLGSKDLATYGTITYDPADQKTGADGTASMVFTPNDEEIPGIGKEIVRTGSLLATPLYQSAFGESGFTSTGFYTQFFQNLATGWQVAFHRAKGFKFSEVHFQSRRPDDDVFDWTMSGQVCSFTPYVNWTIDFAIKQTFKGKPVPGSSGSFLQSMSKSHNGDTWDIESGGKIDFIIAPQYPAKMAVEMTPWTGYPLTTQPIVTVPLTEDTGCSDNSADPP